LQSCRADRQADRQSRSPSRQAQDDLLPGRPRARAGRSQGRTDQAPSTGHQAASTAAPAKSATERPRVMQNPCQKTPAVVTQTRPGQRRLPRPRPGAETIRAPIKPGSRTQLVVDLRRRHLLCSGLLSVFVRRLSAWCARVCRTEWHCVLLAAGGRVDNSAPGRPFLTPVDRATVTAGLWGGTSPNLIIPLWVSVGHAEAMIRDCARRSVLEQAGRLSPCWIPERRRIHV
jgi:hypothetical protein